MQKLQSKKRRAGGRHDARAEVSEHYNSRYSDVERCVIRLGNRFLLRCSAVALYRRRLVAPYRARNFVFL
eukprot:2259467-Prymnesium_polylepis.1